MTTIFSTKKARKIPGKFKSNPLLRWWPNGLWVPCQWDGANLDNDFFSRWFMLIGTKVLLASSRRTGRKRVSSSVVLESLKPWERIWKSCWDCKIDFLGIKVLSHTIKALRNDKRAFKGPFLRALEINTNWDLNTIVKCDKNSIFSGARSRIRMQASWWLLFFAFAPSRRCFSPCLRNCRKKSAMTAIRMNRIRKITF